MSWVIDWLEPLKLLFVEPPHSHLSPGVIRAMEDDAGRVRAGQEARPGQQPAAQEEPEHWAAAGLRQGQDWLSRPDLQGDGGQRGQGRGQVHPTHEVGYQPVLWIPRTQLGSVFTNFANQNSEYRIHIQIIKNRKKDSTDWQKFTFLIKFFFSHRYWYKKKIIKKL